MWWFVFVSFFSFLSRVTGVGNRRSNASASSGGSGVRFSTYSHRSVYDPNKPGGPSYSEYESFTRGVREGHSNIQQQPNTRPQDRIFGAPAGSAQRPLVSETHRTYSDSSGYERVGLSRTVMFIFHKSPQVATNTH